MGGLGDERGDGERDQQGEQDDGEAEEQRRSEAPRNAQTREPAKGWVQQQHDQARDDEVREDAGKPLQHPAEHPKEDRATDRGPGDHPQPQQPAGPAALGHHLLEVISERQLLGIAHRRSSLRGTATPRRRSISSGRG